MADTPTDIAPRSRATALILVAVAALAAYLLLLRHWPGEAVAANPPSMVLPLLGFCIALCTGIAVGLWWPSMRVTTAQDVEPSAAPTPEQSADSQALAVARADDTPTVSALMEEEHIIGAQPASKPDLASSLTAETVTVQPAAETSNPVVEEAAIQTPVTPPLQPSAAIDDRPRDEALSAKDEVIRSLENIVKENRDRWADFEHDRDALEAKIKNLESELRIAHQIIENGGDENDVFTPPQVFSRA